MRAVPFSTLRAHGASPHRVRAWDHDDQSLRTLRLDVVDFYLLRRCRPRWCSQPSWCHLPRRFPDIVLDVTTTQEGRTELVAAGFDAGIHLGEWIQRDMVAVRVSRDHRLAVVGSPDYVDDQWSAQINGEGLAVLLELPAVRPRGAAAQVDA